MPSVDELAEFMQGCRERKLPFKATAGLHHAVRQGDAHGFVNLLAAAVFDEEALAEEDAAAFRLDETHFMWRDRAAAPIEILDARELFVGSAAAASSSRLTS